MSFVSRNHPQQVAVRGPLDEVDDRGTPQDFFDELSARYGPFTLDVAAAPHNAKCERYYTRADDGLLRPWGAGFRSSVVWCNPPYSNLEAWLRKAWNEWNFDVAERIVMLLPANRPEQPWWQKHVEPYRDRPGSPLRTEFLAGRLRFIKPGQTEIKPNERPPFGCCLLIWDCSHTSAVGSDERSEDTNQQAMQAIVEDAAERWQVQQECWDIGTPEQRGTPAQVSMAWHNAGELRCWAKHLMRADELLNAPDITPPASGAVSDERSGNPWIEGRVSTEEYFTQARANARADAQAEVAGDLAKGDT